LAFASGEEAGNFPPKFGMFLAASEKYILGNDVNDAFLENFSGNAAGRFVAERLLAEELACSDNLQDNLFVVVSPFVYLHQAGLEKEERVQRTALRVHGCETPIRREFRDAVEIDQFAPNDVRD
jgi:hypothetical protein